MSELLTRTISGIVFLAVVVACVLLSPWTCAALLLVVVGIGTFEMCRLHGIMDVKYLILSELLSLSAYVLAALVALHFLSMRWLVLELFFLMLPFLFALFSTKYDHKTLFSCLYASLAFLGLPCALMVFMYRSDLFGLMAGAHLILLVFGLLWVNDIFAYLTGRLLGKHKLFPRISPGKTIEGSLGGLVFTVIAMVVFGHYASWLPISAAVGMAAIAVVFGTLGDLCESMLKRQAGVKDSGKLIPGHGGILDRFDSVLFSVPFIFVYLLLL
jgi:phosphatidate cytidylyltransferase